MNTKAVMEGRLLDDVERLEALLEDSEAKARATKEALARSEMLSIELSQAVELAHLQLVYLSLITNADLLMDQVSSDDFLAAKTATTQAIKSAHAGFNREARR